LKHVSVSLAAFWLTAVFTASSVSGQRVSTLVFPSEDEIRQALEMGEIEISHYLRLLELSQTGIDTSDSYLFDEIPNLAGFLWGEGVLRTDLECEQESGFLDTTGTVSRGYVRYQTGKELREQGRSRYRTALRLELHRHWRLTARVNREYTGRERMGSRLLEYRNPHGALRSLKIGSFTERYGLGAACGYSGRRLSFADKLTGESLLYPDFGGYNGVSSDVRSGTWGLRALVSAARDRTHRLETTGAAMTRTFGRTDISLIGGATRLINRSTRRFRADTKTALSLGWQYSKGRAAVEVAQQWSGRGALAALLEWRHRLERAHFGIAAWHYGERFDGLVSGAKSGGLSRAKVWEDVSYEYRDRMSGQSGLFVRTVTRIAPRTDFLATAQAGGIDGDSAGVELLCGLTHRVSPDWTIRFDWLIDHQRTLPPKDCTEQQVRFEPRFSGANVRLRTYIAFTRSTDRKRERSEEYWSWFARVSLDLHDMGRLDLWTNVSRIENGSLDYWYGYVQHEQPLFESILVVLKLSRAYRRNMNPPGYTQFAIQVTAAL
jgi:hypothetical protein